MKEEVMNEGKQIPVRIDRRTVVYVRSEKLGRIGRDEYVNQFRLRMEQAQRGRVYKHPFD
jgi:hypothetical protein